MQMSFRYICNPTFLQFELILTHSCMSLWMDTHPHALWAFLIQRGLENTLIFSIHTGKTTSIICHCALLCFQMQEKWGFFFCITTKIILQQHLNHVSIWLPTTAVMKFTVSHSRKISQPRYYTTLWQSPGVIISVKVVEINCREGLTCLPKGVLPKSCSALILLQGWHAWLQINFNPVQEVLKRIWKSIPSCKIFKASRVLPHYLLRAPKIMRCSLKPFV